jgi:predicted ATPase/DNA-binding XRE family transcriptional regulator
MGIPFARWLKQRRKALNFTQAELARQLGCAVVTIQKIEEGKRRPSKQIAGLLADHLAIPAGEREKFVQMARGNMLDTLPLPPSNLPHPLTSLIGREQEMQIIERKLRRADVRLLTLVGTPGVGKTRLAIEAGHALRPFFEDGVWFVSLAAVADGAFVFATVAQALGLRERGESALQETLFHYLRPRQLLLVLDNYEQLVDHSPLVADLLRACSQVKALVTSQSPLHLSGEHQLAVQPFPLPEIQPALASDRLSENPAIRLLVERVSSSQPDFVLDAANTETMAMLCVHLDGLPLALELAAARLSHVPPDVLLNDLANTQWGRLHWLTNGARDLPQRQRTLRKAIEWSYQLLSPPEQRLFVGLGVFAGGFDAEAAREVGIGESDAHIPSLKSLVDKCLLQVSYQEGAAPRYTLLETLREFALDKLADEGKIESMRRRHAAYFLSLAEGNHPIQSENRHEPAWLARLALNQENLRAALSWGLKHEPVCALRLAAALGHFWCLYGRWREGGAWLEQALQAADGPSDVRARALTSLGILLSFRGEKNQAIAVFQRALHYLRDRKDSPDLPWTLFHMAHSLVHQGEMDAGTRLFEESAALWQQLGYEWHIALAREQLGFVALEQGDLLRAKALLEESCAIHRAWQAEGSVASALIMLGAIERELNDPVATIEMIEEARVIFQKLDRRGDVAWALRDLGIAAVLARRLEDARRYLLESLAIYEAIGGKDGIAIILEGLAAIAAVSGEAERCLHLLGATTALRQQLGLALVSYSAKIDETLFQPLRRQLPAEQWEAGMAAGRALKLNEALALARSG